jgi:hypothetical protein
MLNKIYANITQYIKSEYPFSLVDKIGICVLFANKYKQTGKVDECHIVESVIENIIEMDDYTQSDLINGSSGVLWLLKYLKKLEILDFSLNDIQIN